MEFRVKHRFVRISPFKARKIANMVRDKSAEDALVILKFLPKKAALILDKMLKSAIANAEQSETPVAPEDLYVRTVFVDEGPTMKRFMFRAQGRVYRIRKRTSHVTMILSEKAQKTKSNSSATRSNKS